MIKNLNKLKNLIKFYDLDGYIVPKNDEFFSEYAFPNRLKNISNFTGSAGFALILKRENYLFVDGRYTTQAKIQSGKDFKILQIPNCFPYNILQKFNNKLKIGFDPKIFTNFVLSKYFRDTSNLIPINRNLIDKISKKKEIKKVNSFYNLNHETAGETTKSKINRLLKILKKKKIDNIFISAPENVAWLLNLRGKDNPNSPIPNCRLILTKNKKIYLFADLKKIKKIKKFFEYKNFKFLKFSEFYFILNQLTNKKFCIDQSSCSIFYESLISSKFEIKSFIDPCYHLKAIKNSVEINNMKYSHIEDGVALTKFLFWIKNHNLKNLSELDVQKKLENFRKKNKNYLYPSFNTIAGTGPNAAIIHYRADKESNRKISKKDLLLCDSGGQYKFGTTDVTRTVCFKKPSKMIREIFTRILKGHIAVFTTNLKKINKGYQIDKRARYWLKKINLDYEHGTGHGVGYFLNVHEGPQAISKYNKIPIEKGMILSNEPGYYKENNFGIRIENLVYVDGKKNNLKFKNLTMAPIDKDLIDDNILSKEEKLYLFNYHLEIYSKISKFLNSKEKKWMKNLF